MNKCLNMKDLNYDPLLSIKKDFIKKVGNVKDFRLWEYCVCIYNSRVSKIFNNHILDIGSGGSILPIYLSLLGNYVTVCDLPSSGKYKKTIEYIRQYKEKFKTINIDWDYEDARNLSYFDNKFDIIFCVSVLEHIPNDEDIKAFKEIYRILKPGGIFVGTVDFKRKGELAATDKDIGQGFYDKDILMDRIQSTNFKLDGITNYDLNRKQWANIKDTPPIGQDYTMASFRLVK